MDREPPDNDAIEEPLQPAVSDDEANERAGVYLAAIAALVVPSLIVLAVYLPALSPSGGGDRSTTAADARANLDQVEVEAILESTSEESVPVEVAGAGEVQSEITTEIGEAAGIVAEPATGLDRTDEPILEQPSGESQIAGPSTSTAQAADGEAPTTPSAPTTTIEPTPTIAPTTTAATENTTTTTTTTTEETTAPDEEPPAFSQRIDFGRIGETTVQFRFMAATNTGYTTTIRSGSEVVSRTRGSAQANVLVNETVGDLSSGTEYTVQVELDGPPVSSSPRVGFRTSGGAAEPEVDDVAVMGLRVSDVGSTRFEVNYESNICANGSFVIRVQGGAVVGRNAGQAAGCTTRHLGIPGFWTARLEPNTTYVITVQVEANGAGQGDGNIATQSLTVTTNA